MSKAKAKTPIKAKTKPVKTAKPRTPACATKEKEIYTMEKINLNAIARTYHAKEAKKAKECAVALVEKEIIPLLESAAKAGQYSYQIEIKQEGVLVSDVQKEIAERVQCRFIGYGKSFFVTW